jgi:hypothetical protein
LPLKGDHPIGEVSTSLLRDQASFHRCTSKPNSHHNAKQPSQCQTAITKPSSRCHTQTSSPRTGRETAMEVASRITRLREGHWPEMVEHELNMRKHHPAIGLKLFLWHRHKKLPHKESQGSAWLRTSSICHLAII